MIMTNYFVWFTKTYSCNHAFFLHYYITFFSSLRKTESYCQQGLICCMSGPTGKNTLRLILAWEDNSSNYTDVNVRLISERITGRDQCRVSH